MPSPSLDRATARLLASIRAIPAGYVTTHGDLARHAGIAHRLVATTLAALGDADRQTIPWWRVVADGGAIGRHPLRDLQIALLRQDGVPVAPAGIVQELAFRRVSDPGAPPDRPYAQPATPLDAKPARSRGMKSHPT